jgi:hypothetical protein
MTFTACSVGDWPAHPRARRRGLWHRARVTEPASAAFQRFVDALNQSRDEALLRAAVTDDIHLERFRPGEPGATAVAEAFSGVPEVVRWFARTPPVVRFSLAGAPALEPDGAWRVEYALSAGEFHNGGIWVARLAGDGRITRLAHHPFALRE